MLLKGVNCKKKLFKKIKVKHLTVKETKGEETKGVKQIEKNTMMAQSESNKGKVCAECLYSGNFYSISNEN